VTAADRVASETRINAWAKRPGTFTCARAPVSLDRHRLLTSGATARPRDVPTAYAVDRLGRLAEGLVLERVRHADLDPPLLQAHVDALFPAGVTEHGNGYFLNSRRSATDVSANLELVFEYVRRASFDHAPSRFEAAFGFETAAEAQAFRASPIYGHPTAAVWELETPHEPFRADMTCLTLRGSMLRASYVAERYWTQQDNGFQLLGEPPTPPVWEWLLRPPVTVVRRVAQA
jgi:hypothetical protein